MATNGTHPSLDWKVFYNIIDGKPESTKETRHSINPATGEPNPEVPVSTQDDVDRAMQAAKKASKGWANTAWSERRDALLAFADAIEVEKDGFVEMLITEQGKPHQFAVVEIDMTLIWMRTLAGLELSEEKIVEKDREIIVRFTPLGVAVGIVPWNYPILLAASKIVPSLLTGNPMIIKPSPFTPAGDLKLVELGQRFFPPGVLQCLSGDDNLGPWLTAHPTPQKISFTGSSATGKKVMESCAKTLKRVTLELGGKDPAIICEDVDIEDVAAKVATFAFLNSGQICLALKRIFVHEKIYPDFRDAVGRHAQKLKVGEGHEEGTFLGPVNNQMQYDRVKTFFSDIEKDKLDVVVGGKVPEDKKGYWITPTIIDQPPRSSRLMIEEPFGPIIPLYPFSSDDEAIDLANDTAYGLGASVWSRDTERAERIARQIEAGTVWVNTHFELDARVAFGGHKESGIGTEWGVGGLKAYCNSQSLFFKKA